MSRELPEGWVEVQLGSIATLHNGDRGKNYPSGEAILDSGVPFINAGHIQNGGLEFGKMNYISEERFDLLGGGKVQPGDLLYCLRGSLGKTAIVPPDVRGAIASSLVILRPSKAVLPGLAYSFLTSPLGTAEIEKFDNGSAQPNLSAKSVTEYNFPLPPLNEQKRIVAKIDALTEKSREARQALDEVPALLDQLRQSILAAAFRGDLTKKWREQNPNVEPASVLLERIRQERRRKWEESELAKFRAKGKLPPDDKWKTKYVEPEPVDTEGLPELPEGWCWASVEELGEVRLGRQRSPDRATGPNMRPYMRAANVGWGGLRLEDVKEMDFTDEEFEIYGLQVGDVLVGEASGSKFEVGKSAVWQGEVPGSCFQNTLIRVRPEKEVRSSFLQHRLQFDALRGALAEVSKGVGIHHLGAQGLASWLVPLCSVREQDALVEALTQCLAVLKTTTERIGAYEHDLASLDSSILAKAFRGELVPQDPTDEPASVLLERIRKERDGSAPKKSRKAKG